MLVVIAVVAVVGLAFGATTAGARQRVKSASPPSYPAIGAAVDTMAPHAGGGYEIRIGGNCTSALANCPVQHFPYGSKPVQLLVFKRSSLSLVGDLQLGGGVTSASKAAALVITYGAQGGYLLVLAALPGRATVTNYRVALSFLTGSAGVQYTSASGGWSAIGVPNVLPPGGVSGVLNVGASQDPGRLAGDLRGYFQQSLSTGNYSFVTGRYATYNTRAGGSTATTDVIRIGSARYSVSLPTGCSGGYSLVVVTAATLTPISHQAIGTNCGAASQDQAGLQALETTLDTAAATHRRSQLVFMQSIGAHPVATNSGMQPIAAESGGDLEALGGSAEIWNRSVAAGTGYALVGASAVVGDAGPAATAEAYGAETASAVTRQPAQLQGMLRNDHNYNYVPVTGAATPTPLAPSLVTLVYGTTTPWPTGATANQQKALEYISAGMPRQNGAPRFTPLQYSPSSSCYQPVHRDVRFEFCDLTRNYGDVLQALGDNKAAPAGCDCGTTGKAWARVRADVMYEISLRGKVLSYMKLLGGVYNSGSGCTTALVDLKSIATTIRTDVTVSNNALITGGRWDSLVSDSFNVLSALSYSDPEIGAVSNFLNDVSAFGYLAGDLLGFSQSGNTLASEVNTTAAQLATQLKHIYCNASNGFGLYTDVLLSNYGKLLTVGSSSAFQFNTSALHAIENALPLGAKQFVYNHLMPAVYHPYALLPSQLNPAVNNGQPATPATFYCPRGYDPTQYRSPWRNIPSGDWTTVSSYDPPTPNSLGGRQAYNLVLSASPPSAGTAIVPPAALIGAITGPVSSSGLGEPLIEFFLHHFPRYAYLCQYSNITEYGPVQSRWP